MEPIPYVIVDAFTDRPLAGNQLAVFTDARAIPEALLHPLARETNFSEAVFVYPPTAGGDARIRIFTPAAELRFAGHPVLGTAVWLATERGSTDVTLETLGGLVPVEIASVPGRPMFGRMRQPTPLVGPFDQAEELLATLGVERSVLPVEVYDNGVPHCFVTLASPADVAALKPDLAALERLAHALDVATMGFNCVAGDGRHWKMRMFSPADGIPEDPATGSAAGPLACHLARHGRIAFGDEIEIVQGVEIGRPSTLFARATGSSTAVGSVEVGGSAIVVARGFFELPDLAR